ncbi:hypothetical protein T484DRAFT_1908993, partial [Baffinella frigidus]
MGQGGLGDGTQHGEEGDFQSGMRKPGKDLTLTDDESEAGSAVEAFSDADTAAQEERTLTATTPLTRMDWRVGSAVEAESGGEWWEGHVIAVAGDLLTIHYVDAGRHQLDTTDDETLPRTSSRLRAPCALEERAPSGGEPPSSPPPHRSDSPSSPGDAPRVQCALPSDDPAVWADIANTKRAATEHLKAMKEALLGRVSPGRVRLASDLAEECGEVEEDCDAAREICAIYRAHFTLEGAHRGRGMEGGFWREGKCFHISHVKSGEHCCDLVPNLRGWMLEKLHPAAPEGRKTGGHKPGGHKP